MGFLFGIGFGYFVQRAGLCFSHGLGEIFMGKGKRIIRMFIVIFVITGIGFWLSGYVSPALGLKPVGQIRGYGFYNIISGMIFGAGIFLCGGCILGTLRQLGEGNLVFLVVLVSFIPGMALTVYVLDPALEDYYHVQKVLIPQLTGLPPSIIALGLSAAAVAWFFTLNRKK
jgi:hypothetical protein